MTLASYGVALLSAIVVWRRFLQERFPSETLVKASAVGVLVTAVCYLALLPSAQAPRVPSCLLQRSSPECKHEPSLFLRSAGCLPWDADL